MALMAIGYRELSMSAASIGPVKAMTLSLNIGEVEREVEAMLAKGREDASLRDQLQRLADRLEVRLSRREPPSTCVASASRAYSCPPTTISISSSSRHQEISAQLAEGVAGAQYSALSRELSELDPVVTAIQAFLAKS